MRHVACAALFLFVCPIALAQMGHHRTATLLPEDNLRVSPCKKELAPAVPQTQFQQAAWKVENVTKEAQDFFNQGMTQYWGFNYEEAMRNFRAAAKANVPGRKMAMASWGLALAAGPNINLGMDHDCHVLAKAASEEALALATEPGAKIAPEQLGVIKALLLRYKFPETQEGKEVDPATAAAAADAQFKYSDAMARVWQKAQDDPKAKDDPNVGALYAESMVELHPWALFKNNGCPDPDAPVSVPLIFDVLARSIAKAPETVGANHYWIHVAEASPTPSGSLTSANLMRTLVKQSGHLVHMSSHIYLRMGNYQESLEANEKAVDNDVMNDKDHSGYGAACSGPYLQYSGNHNHCPELYYGHYLSHNYFFGSVSATFSGQSQEAMKLACATRAHVERFVIYEPGLQRYMTAPLMTMVVNRNWDKIIKETEPPDPQFHDCYRQLPFHEDSGCHILRSIYYWARGMALTARGRVEDARKALHKMEDERSAIQGHPPETWGNNEARNVLSIADATLNARIYWADNAEETAFFNLRDIALKLEDNLRYDEPPQWFTPVREALGGAYLRAGRYDTAIDTFKEELERHPASGRALYGLTRALQERAPQLADKKEQAAMAEQAGQVKDEFCRAWRNADYTMTDDDLWPASRLNPNKGGGGVTCSSTEKKLPNPSECTCLALTWPPQPDATDPAIKDLRCAPPVP